MIFYYASRYSYHDKLLPVPVNVLQVYKISSTDTSIGVGRKSNYTSPPTACTVKPQYLPRNSRDS